MMRTGRGGAGLVGLRPLTTGIQAPAAGSTARGTCPPRRQPRPGSPAAPALTAPAAPPRSSGLGDLADQSDEVVVAGGADDDGRDPPRRARCAGRCCPDAGVLRVSP